MLYFEKLIVWQKSMNLAVKLVKLADGLPSKYQYSFSDQLRRAALSIPNNIAEGAGRKSRKDSAMFYSIAKGSTYESMNILILLSRLNLIEAKAFDFNSVETEIEEIVKMLYSLSK